MKIKMREKYVDEAQPPLFIFGKYNSGNVDVSSANRDVFEDIPEEIAKQIVKLNTEYMEKLYQLLCH